jgi:hypothetical protein
MPAVFRIQSPALEVFQQFERVVGTPETSEDLRFTAQQRMRSSYQIACYDRLVLLEATTTYNTMKIQL